MSSSKPTMEALCFTCNFCRTVIRQFPSVKARPPAPSLLSPTVHAWRADYPKDC